MLSRLGRIAALMGVVVATLLPAVPAQAAPCTLNQHIWWKQVNTGGGEMTGTTGMRASIRRSDWSLAACDDARVWSMAHMELTDPGDMREVGIRRITVDSGGSYRLKVAYAIVDIEPETYVINAPLSDYCPSGQIGDDYRFKLVWAEPSWEAWIMCPGSSTFTYLTQWNPVTNDDDGMPMMEIGRVGSTTTFCCHHGHNLDYKSYQGVWDPWPNMRCHIDQVSGWQGEKVNNQHFESALGSEDCTET